MLLKVGLCLWIHVLPYIYWIYFSPAYEDEALCKLWANLLLVNQIVWCQYSNCATEPEEGVFEILSSRIEVPWKRLLQLLGACVMAGRSEVG